MSKIKITAPIGQRVRDIKTNREFSEVVCDEKDRNRYELTDGDLPKVETVKTVSLVERIADLESAVEEIAVKSKVSIDLKAKAGTVEKEVAKK